MVIEIIIGEIVLNECSGLGWLILDKRRKKQRRRKKGTKGFKTGF